MEGQVMEAPSSGLFYSWSNNSIGADRVSSRIDRAYVNDVCILKYPEVIVNNLPSGVSDHFPLLTDFGCNDTGGGRHF